MPSGVRQLSELRLQSQQRANMENSQFLSTSEWNANINKSIEELYDILIEKFGSSYYEAPPFSITTDGTNYLFALPSDFYKLLGVDLLVNGSPQLYVPLDSFMLGERGQNPYQGGIPAAGQTIRVLYAPRFVELVNDTDTFDGISGWDEYVIVDAAIKAKDKEESDTSSLERRKAALIARIESAAANRDAGNPKTVRDVYARRRAYPYFRGPGVMKYRLSGSNLWLENSVPSGVPYGF
jgi:hypothetical protein